MSGGSGVSRAWTLCCQQHEQHAEGVFRPAVHNGFLNDGRENDSLSRAEGAVYSSSSRGTKGSMYLPIQSPQRGWILQIRSTPSWERGPVHSTESPRPDASSPMQCRRHWWCSLCYCLPSTSRLPPGTRSHVATIYSTSFCACSPSSFISLRDLSISLLDLSILAHNTSNPQQTGCYVIACHNGYQDKSRWQPAAKIGEFSELHEHNSPKNKRIDYSTMLGRISLRLPLSLSKRSLLRSSDNRHTSHTTTLPLSRHLCCEDQGHSFASSRTVCCCCLVTSGPVGTQIVA